MTPAIILAAMLAQPPADQPAKAEKPAAQPSQPSLDDLLGIPKDTKPGAKARPPAPDPNAKALEQKLSAAEAADQLKQAVMLMGQTAERLQTSKDTGLATQRIQEDILRKLDQVIKAAEQNQQQSQRQRSQGQRDKQQQQPDQQQSQQRNPAGVEPAPDTIDPPGQKKAEPNPGVAARGAAWGALPEHLRDALTQGNTDKYSAIWQKWTEAYYKRLAEDANK